MKLPQTPDNENLRLEALQGYDILDTSPEPQFDDITLLASQICNTPIALVSLVDQNRQWFKSHHGIDATETPREVAFCAHAINESEPLIVKDTALDDRFKDNPLVTDGPNVKFYAGAQLITPMGYKLGTLCVIDHSARHLSPIQIQMLEALARQVVAQLELRRLAMLARRREKFLETILGSLPGLVSYVDINFKFQYCNSAYEKWFKMAPKDCVGKSIPQVIGDDAFKIAKPYFEQVFAGKPQQFERSIPFRSGGNRIVAVTLIPDHDESGNMNGVFNLVTDISDLRKNESTAVTKANQLQALFDGMAEGVMVMNANGKIISVNDSALEIIGLNRPQIVGSNAFDPRWTSINEDLSTCSSEELPSYLAMTTGQTQRRRIMGIRHHNQTVRWVSITATPIFKSDATFPNQVLMTLSDITELKRREAERDISNAQLSASKRLLTSVLETLPVAVFGKDIKKQFQYVIWNKRAEELFGTSAEKCLGTYDSDHFTKEQADFFRSKDIEASLSSEIIDIPAEPAQTAAGTVILHTRKVVVRDDQGKPSILLGVSEDITAKIEAQKTIHDQQIKLIASTKMSALGEMAGGIAHEINNPLAIINGKASQLKRMLRKPDLDIEKLTTELTKIEATVERISKIIKGLRVFSRNSDSDPMERSSVNQIIEDTLELMKERFKFDSIELRVNCPPDLWIDCRPTQITQILSNLMSNARDAISSIKEKWVALDVKINADRVHITVTDCGLGIPHAVVDKLMQPFFTTKEVGKGTGLGLSISKGIAEDHKGHLRYNPNSKHTQFELELPIQQPLQVTLPVTKSA